MDVVRCTQRPTVLLWNGKLPIRCFQRSQGADLPTRKLHRFSIADSSIVYAQNTSLVQSTSGAVRVIWRGAFATTARPRHAAKILWSSLFLHTRAHQKQQTHAVPTTPYRFEKPSRDMLLMGELPSRGRHVVSIKLRQRLHNG